MDWMPIESAPRDGEEIIVGVDMASVWIVRSARFVEKESWMEEDAEEIEGWWSYCNSISQERLEGYYTPTHWMPLPPPPAKE